MHRGLSLLGDSPAAQPSDVKAICVCGAGIIAFGDFQSFDI
jgi:hypothetical protein